MKNENKLNTHTHTKKNRATNIMINIHFEREFETNKKIGDRILKLCKIKHNGLNYFRNEMKN